MGKELFLDSGAFTLYSRSSKYAKDHGVDRWEYYDTPEFWSYVDEYAEFVKRYKDDLDLYANMDAIGNPKLSWRNQKYLEKKHGLSPVPVIHGGTSLKWLRRYIDSGYEIVGLGGLKHVKGTARRQWLDDCFNVICDTPDRLPRIKTHGFGFTSFTMMLRYPWYSVDSTTWAKRGAFGEILVPQKRGGRFIFTKAPYTLAVSMENTGRRRRGKHLLTLTPPEQRVVHEWLELAEVPLGKEENGEVIEDGVITNPYCRWNANLFFFEKVRKAIPPYPWAFGIRRWRPTFGL